MVLILKFCPQEDRLRGAATIFRFSIWEEISWDVLFVKIPPAVPLTICDLSVSMFCFNM